MLKDSSVQVLNCYSSLAPSCGGGSGAQSCWAQLTRDPARSAR